MIRRVAAATAALLALSACATTGGTAAPGTGPANSDAPAVPASSSKPEQGTADIGDAFSYDDGLKIEITKASSEKSSASAYPAKKPMIVLTVRVTNGTDKTFDSDLTQVQVSYGADGDQAELVVDTTAGITGGLTGSVVKGKSKSAKYAFAVPTKEQDDVTVEVTPDFEHDPAIFSGNID